VKTFFVDGNHIQELSHALQPSEGESPTELLPELQELPYSTVFGHHAFIPFIDARQKAGRPITMIDKRALW
jgi:hypothetical protein